MPKATDGLGQSLDLPGPSRLAYCFCVPFLQRFEGGGAFSFPYFLPGLLQEMGVLGRLWKG